MIDLKAFSENPQDPVELPLAVGFYDLTHYMKWAQNTPPLEALSKMDSFFAFSASIIEDNNGLFIKAIGDAGLFAFPAATNEDTDNAVKALIDLKTKSDQWLADALIPSRVILKVNKGDVACGWVGAADQKRFDLYGDVVNQAAVLPAKSFSVTDDLMESCSPAVRSLFTHRSNTCWDLRNQTD